MMVPSLHARSEGTMRLCRFQSVCRDNANGWHGEVDGLRVQKHRSEVLIRELLGFVVLPAAQVLVVGCQLPEQRRGAPLVGDPSGPCTELRGQSAMTGSTRFQGPRGHEPAIDLSVVQAEVDGITLQFLDQVPDRRGGPYSIALRRNISQDAAYCPASGQGMPGFGEKPQGLDRPGP